MFIFLAVVAIWASTGVAIAAVLARYGHSFWLFAAIGVAYGPLLLFVWLRGASGQPTQSLLHASGATPETGWIDVLVGLDGSNDSIVSAGRVLKTLGPAVRRVRLTSAIDHEMFNAPDAFTIDDERLVYLEHAAAALGTRDAELSLVSGQPASALMEHVDANEFDLLIVANHGSHVASALRGSTVARLARSSSVPVLIGPPAE